LTIDLSSGEHWEKQGFSMLVFCKYNLIFFAVPKTGTTSYHAALKGKADIIFRGRPAVKHMNVRKYQRSFAPFLDKAFDLRPETMAVMREPLDLMRSWYKYRSRLPKGDKNGTKGISFEQFIRAALQENSPPYAAVGNQMTFLQNDAGTNGVNHLFAIEHADVLNEFLGNVFNDLGKIPRKNVSPSVPTPISTDLEAEFREARADEYALYNQVIKAGGYLNTPG
jgi:hypothetical protein